MKLALLVPMFVLMGALCAKADTLRIATSADFAPWESVDASGAIVGFDRDVGNEVCERLKVECSWANQAFDGLLPALQVGKYDLIISALSISEEREKSVDFSVAYADAPNNVAVPSGSPIAAVKDVAGLEAALAGKIIGVQTGSTHEQVVRKHFARAEVRLYDRADQIGDDLAAGRLDAGLMERSAWDGLMQARNDKALVFAGPPLTSADYPEFGRGQAFALKKGQAALKSKLDATLTAMLGDGTISAFSQKWFKYDISPKHK